MARLTYRSLLLSTVLSITPISYGAADDGGLRVESTPYPSVASLRTPSVVTPAPQTVERPTEHFCPITQDVMTDPVVASDGFSYEREAILEWIASHGTSPMTREAISAAVHPNQSLKLLIEEWNPNQTYRPSALSELSPQEIVELLKNEFDKNKRLLEPEHTAAGKDIVVFLGNTGAGKSTLINFLAGKSLNVVGNRYVLANASDQTSMPIGGRMFNSETLYPKSIDIGNLRYFDLPGFNDTDGSIRNLVNAAFIRRILLEANSVRFVYVAGQDQFTADRGASVNAMTQMLRRLFVTSSVSADPVNQGLFVITKEDQLIDDVIAVNQADLPGQIKEWYTNNRIDRMYHSGHHDQNSIEHHQQLLERIERLMPMTLSTINVSALYPPETAQDLERMYTKMFKDAYEQKKATPITTVTDHRTHIEEWKQGNFWERFENGYFNDVHPSAATLRGFATLPYQNAREAFVQAHEVDKGNHIRDLEELLQNRIDEIERNTIERAEAEVKAIREEQGLEGVVPFDFANHVLYQERVCGREVLERFTSNPAEHEIARSAYRGWIGAYNQRQLQHQLEASSLHGQITNLEQQLGDMTANLQRQNTVTTGEIANLQRQNTNLEQQLRDMMARHVGDIQRLEQQVRAQHDEIVALQEIVNTPEIARGHEAAYRQFEKGKLIYKPDPNSDAGKIELPFAGLTNLLGGVFDISGCGDSAKNIQISTGFRTAVNPENGGKLEVWIVPQFQLQKNPNARRYYDFLQTLDDHRDKPYAIIFNYGGWIDLNDFWLVGSDGGNRMNSSHALEADRVAVGGTCSIGREAPSTRSTTVPVRLLAAWEEAMQHGDLLVDVDGDEITRRHPDAVCSLDAGIMENFFTTTGMISETGI